MIQWLDLVLRIARTFPIIPNGVCEGLVIQRIVLILRKFPS